VDNSTNLQKSTITAGNYKNNAGRSVRDGACPRGIKPHLGNNWQRDGARIAQSAT